MPKVATLKGEVLDTVTVVKDTLEYVITEGNEEGSIRVTPKAFGKFLNSSAFEIPAVVVPAVKGLK